MKKILIWLLLFNIIVFSEEIDLLKQMDDSKYEENAVNFFLDTIRKKNNLLVINILDIEKIMKEISFHPSSQCQK